MNAVVVTEALKTFQQLADEAKVAREKREMEKALSEYKRFKVPAIGRGQIRYMWASDCVVDIECHLDYEPEEHDTRDCPGYPATVSLRAAYLRGVDIYEMLSEKQIDRIEEAALIQHGEEAREAEAEYRYDRWMERAGE
jgi:hypothetical protein